MSLTPQAWKRIEEIFNAALEREENERKAFVEERVEGDQAVAQVVAEMLSAHEGERTLDLDREVFGLHPEGSELAIGERLGNYQLRALLGRGGMGEVYRAFDTRLDREVALKILPTDFTDPERVSRFEREAKALAAIQHPGVVTVHSVEEADGLHFLTMELLEGRTLAEVLAQEDLPLERFEALGLQLSRALAAAHSSGIVHRDIKPSNVLVSSSDKVSLIDFGLVKASRRTGTQTDLETATGTQAGRVMGTWQYMSPEQARGETVGTASDVFSLGVVLYEMLSGQRPFDRPSHAETVASILHEPAPKLESVRLELPRRLIAIVNRCLEKDPSDRFASAEQVAIALAEASPEALSPSGRGRWLLAATIVLGLLAATGLWWKRGQDKVDRARTEALPRIEALLGEYRLREAAELATEVEQVLGANSAELAPLWPRMAGPFKVQSDPPGAEIFYRPYESDESAWVRLGSTPYDTERFPAGSFRFRIESPGFETAHLARSLLAQETLQLILPSHDYLEDQSYIIEASLLRTDETPEGMEGMVRVAGGLYGAIPLLGFPPVFPTDVPEFWIDRTEVTHAAYREFVAAGGYEDASLWPDLPEGPLSKQATERLVDQTQRPGPATWVLGEPPSNSDGFPVGGVSWFEASAYCRWKGKSLPTFFHWARAALPSSDSWLPFNQALARASNFDSPGPQPTGAGSGLGISGVVDIAGNVREWVATPSNRGRYVMGGGWSDPTYFMHDVKATSPWQREPSDGLRCALYPEGQLPDHLTRALDYPPQEFREIEPSDEVFDTIKQAYAYDPSQPLGARTDSVEELDWGGTVEWVSINTVYGDRLPLRIHRPTNSPKDRPSRAIVHIGGGNVLRSDALEPLSAPFTGLVRSGLVFVEPVLDGTFQRNDGRTLQRLAGEGRFEFIAHWVQDVGRTLDFLEADPETDGDRVAYLGLSTGGDFAPRLLPFESRFKAMVLYSSGYSVLDTQESVDERTGLLRRIEIPALVLGGRRDFSVPVELQRQMVRFLGTPEGLKRQVVYDSSHWPLPTAEVLRETVDFLDKNL